MINDATHAPDGSADESSSAELVFAVGQAAAPVSGRREPALVGAGGRADAEPSPAAADLRQPRPADIPTWSFGVPEPAAATDQAELPLPAAPAPPIASRPLPLFGPVGRRRPVLVVAALSAATLGVYALIWHRRVNREMEEFDPKLHARPGRSAAAVAVPWALGLLATLAGAAWLVAHRLAIPVPFGSAIVEWQALALLAGLLAIPYLVLAIPFSAVAVVMTLERLRCVEEHVGLTADRQVRAVSTAMLLLLPFIGGLAMLTIAQRRLNTIWQQSAPQGWLDR